jgi:hypothetical protein
VQLARQAAPLLLLRLENRLREQMKSFFSPLLF